MPAMDRTKDTAMIGITDTDFLVQLIAPRKKYFPCRRLIIPTTFAPPPTCLYNGPEAVV